MSKVRTIIVEVSGGGTASILNSIKEVAGSASAKINFEKGDVIEFSSPKPESALLRIRLIYPQVKISERRDGRVVPFKGEELPEWLEGFGVSCPNKNCVTSQPKEPSRPKFKLVSWEPVTLQCYYCGRYMDHSQILAQLATF